MNKPWSALFSREEWGYRALWLRGEAGAILIVLTCVCLLAGIVLIALRQIQGPRETEHATVVRFGSYSTDVGNIPLVVVRTREGRQQQLSLPSRNALAHCRKGSRIRLVRRGAGLFVHPRGCAPMESAPI